MISHDVKVGERAVHILTCGRIRGKVVKITITEQRTTATLEVDCLGGRKMTYNVENLCPEKDWD